MRTDLTTIYSSTACLCFVITLAWTSAPGQAWNKIPSDALRELPFKHVNTIVATDSGVYIGGNYGLAYYDYVSKSFEWDQRFTQTCIVQIEAAHKVLFARSDVGNVYQIAPHFQQLTAPDEAPLRATDMVCKDEKLYITSQISGMYVFTDSTVEHRTMDNSFFSENSLMSIAFIQDKLYVGGYGGLYSSDGVVINSGSGLIGNQVYLLSTRKDTLYLATEGGIQVIVNGNLKEISKINDVSAYVKSFSTAGKHCRIITDNGIWKYSNGLWKSESFDDQEPEKVNAVLSDQHTYLACDDKLRIYYDQGFVDYKKSLHSYTIKSAAINRGRWFGITTNNFLFQYDYTSGRYKLGKQITGIKSPRSIQFNADDRCFVYGQDMFYDCYADSIYPLPKSAAPDRDLLFFEPVYKQPAVLQSNGDLYVFRDTAFAKLEYTPSGILSPCLSVKNDAEGNAYFLYADHIDVWETATPDGEEIKFNSCYGFHPHTFHNMHFFNGDTVLLASWDFFVIRAFHHKAMNKGSFEPLLGPESVAAAGDHHFLAKSPIERVIHVFSSDSARRVISLHLPMNYSEFISMAALGNQVQCWLEDGLYYVDVDLEKSMQKPINGILCYPNPAKDVLTINIPNVLEGEAQLKLFNINGALVMTDQIQIFKPGQRIHLDVSNQIPGTYYISISNKQSWMGSPFLKL